MHALTVLFGGSLSNEAFAPVLMGQSAFSLALKQACAFPGSTKTVLFTGEGEIPGSLLAEQKPEIIQKSIWTVSELLKNLSELSIGFDFVYYAWADSPFLDPVLAGKIAERHTRYAADYSYADGWPYGLGPELINSYSAGILFKIAGEIGEGPVKRDSIFSVLQKDINSFDIETEISITDLRHHRLSFTANSKRNLLLLERFAGLAPNAENSAQLIADHPEYLRTLPAFFPIQVSGPCPKTGGSCDLCPYRQFGAKEGPVTERSDFLAVADFTALLDKIQDFAGDGVIDISLWGEISLHPQREEIIRLVLERPALSLLIETSAYGWEGFNIKDIAQLAAAAKPRLNNLPPLSWIVSLNPADRESEAVSFVKKLLEYFPKERGRDDLVYVEAIRTTGAEDVIEQFYRSWKENKTGESCPGIIIQKYDSFCGFLAQKQAVDLSPIERRPCWHIMRDFPVLLDGTVPLCREDLREGRCLLGNVFREDLHNIWKQGEQAYLSHCRKLYAAEPCGVCDEYYTYNF